MAGSAKSSSSTPCSSRLDQPAPSRRRATSSPTRSSGPPTAARRRSGPNDLEKLWTRTVRAGRCWPTLTSGLVEMSPAWSSSNTQAPVGSSSFARAAARPALTLTPSGLWARGCTYTATGRRARAACRAPGTMPSSSIATATTSAPTVSSRSSTGGKAASSTSTTSPSRTVSAVRRSSASMAPSTTLRWPGRERPAVPEPLGQVGEDGVDEVALGQGAAGDPGERRSEIGQEVRVGGAQGEVEGERTGTGVHAAVALRAAAPGLRTDVGAVPAPGLQDTGAAQGLPGLVHRGGADAEGLGQRPHGGQAGARGQLAARHQAADRGGDGA